MTNKPTNQPPIARGASASYGKDGGRPAFPGAQKSQPTGKRERLALPFDKRRQEEPGEWVYRHRVGLLVTVLLYVVAGILFVSYKIVVNKNPTAIMYIDLVDPEAEAITPKEPPKSIEQLPADAGGPIKNRASDLNAQTNPALRDDRRSRDQTQQINEEVRRVQEQVAAGGRTYREGIDHVEAMTNGQRTPRQTSSSSSSSAPSKNQSVKVQGNVTVAYNLEGRVATYLYMPAYQCRGAGKVVVEITVNRNGEVTAGVVTQASAGAEDCISERALQAAKASSFNASNSAPEKQQGTITYTFVAQ